MSGANCGKCYVLAYWITQRFAWDDYEILENVFEDIYLRSVSKFLNPLSFLI